MHCWNYSIVLFCISTYIMLKLLYNDYELWIPNHQNPRSILNPIVRLFIQWTTAAPIHQITQAIVVNGTQLAISNFQKSARYCIHNWTTIKTLGKLLLFFFLMKYRLFHCMAVWNGVCPCVAYGCWLEHGPSWLLFIFLFMSYKTCLNCVRYIYRYKTCLNSVNVYLWT